ncbi:MAG: DUF3412 domain-containing protein [Woeseiaceae bacterium]|nr:DUF3412 domain-containing protein [Woeseiaceae bacterium]
MRHVHLFKEDADADHFNWRLKIDHDFQQPFTEQRRTIPGYTP